MPLKEKIIIISFFWLASGYHHFKYVMRPFVNYQGFKKYF